MIHVHSVRLRNKEYIGRSHFSLSPTSQFFVYSSREGISSKARVVLPISEEGNSLQLEWSSKAPPMTFHSGQNTQTEGLEVGGEAGKNWERLRGGHKPIMHGMKNEGETGPARGKNRHSGRTKEEYKKGPLWMLGWDSFLLATEKTWESNNYFFLDRKTSFRKVTLTSLIQRLQRRSVWRQENQEEAD